MLFIRFYICLVFSDEENPSAAESEKSKTNPKRQKLAQLAAARKSSDKRSERARKRKDRNHDGIAGKDTRDKAKKWRINLANENESSDDERLVIIYALLVDGHKCWSALLSFIPIF